MTDKPDSNSKTVRDFRLVKGRTTEGELLSSIAAASLAQIVLAVAAVIAICYAAKLPLITLSIAVLIAFILAPLASILEKWRVPRWASSLISVGILLACLYGVIYFSYNRAVDFFNQLPQYSQNIRKVIQPFRQQAEKLQRTTEAVIPSAAADQNTVTIKQSHDLSQWLTSTFSGLTEVILSVSFIPFLVYFMLTWRDHARDATVQLFAEHNRARVNTTLGGIAAMLRAFLVGNFMCGVFISLVSAIVFGFMKLPYFYFLGFISGFLSLVPYLGVFLAAIPPIAAGLGALNGAQMLGICALVVGLHVFAVNVLFPKVVGKRLKLNPLVVSIALLMWGWLWGAMGLLLALPITGALKIIFDHIDSLRPLGAWMEN